MASTATQPTKQAPEAAPISKAPARINEFPFFLSRMRDEFDHLFERFARDWPSFGQGNGWRWGIDVRDDDSAVVVEAEAPGFEAGDFDLQISEGRLVVRATRKSEKKEKEGKVSEFRKQEYYEAVALPAGIDKSKVEAKYHNGMLTVTIPKTAEGKGKKIAVQSA